MNINKKLHLSKDNFDILKQISKEPEISQRKLSKILGFSLGKLNYCIKELASNGYIKVKNANLKNKIFYYSITSAGIFAKKNFAIKFVNENIEEVDDLLKKNRTNINIEPSKNKKKIEKIGIGHNSLNSKINSNNQLKRSKPLFKTIEINIKRRKIIVDDIMSTYKGTPIPSWIELSIIDVCNRTCSFCPKSDPKIAPDTHQRMSIKLIEKLTEELKEIDYKGSVTLCGYGEPMLHKEVNLISNKLSESALVEIVTNGDTLKPKNISDLYENNVNKLLISMYDGDHQIKKFQKMIKESGVPDGFVILRDRWYDSSKDYGIKLTNRSGTINVGDQEKIGKYKKCFYPSYQFLIDWNGDIFLCPQDWQRRITMGNMMQSHIFEIWTSNIMTKYRKDLINGKRKNNPCTSCNAEGTILGINHAKKWADLYKLEDKNLII